MNRRSRAAGAGLAAAVFWLSASPAGAHGFGEGGSLPISWWQFLYAAGFALVIAFLWLLLSWPRPRLAHAATGRSVNGTAGALRLGGWALRTVGLVTFVVTWSAGWIGDESSRNNIAPPMVYVVLWGALPIVIAVFGDLWTALSPFDAMAAGWERLRPRGGAATATAPPDASSAETSLVWSHWPATLGVAGFIWLEMCYHSPSSPRSIALAITIYSVAVMAMAVRYGRSWLRTGEAFAVVFSLIALLAPFGRTDDGRLQLRPPFSGLATFTPRRGTVGLLAVLLGATAFDGVTRMQWWSNVEGDATGWGRTLVLSFGLTWAVGIVAVIYTGATMAAAYIGNTDQRDAPRDYVHTLIPLVLAFSVAHYLGLVLIEGQAAIALASNPYGRNWDLFGTAGRVVDVGVISAAAVAWVQLVAIVVGSVVGLIAARDRALETHPPRPATRVQYPLVAMMGVFAVGGLALLLEG